MEWYRAANLIMQGLYVPVHFAFICRLIARRQPTPIWRWFILVAGGLWMMVFGRLMETIAYVFYPSNDFYVFAVCFQLVGTTFATFSYLIWNLYLAGNDRLAERRGFKLAMLAAACAVSLIVCTNGAHHLFYEKLVMGEQVVHGKLFLPCLLIVYGTLMAGWIISVVHIVKSGADKVRRLLVFSLYPILPAAAALIRSISGVDQLDYTPAVMTVSIACLYLMVFRYRYVDILSRSIETALEQTASGLLVYDPSSGETLYENRAAREVFSGAPDVLQAGKTELSDTFEAALGGRTVRVSETPLNGARQLVCLTDVSDIVRERASLEESISRGEALVLQLQDRKRNIDAYLDALFETPDLKEKQKRLAQAQWDVRQAFGEIESGLNLAKGGGEEAENALNECLTVSREALASVRAAVASLREGQ